MLTGGIALISYLCLSSRLPTDVRNKWSTNNFSHSKRNGGAFNHILCCGNLRILFQSIRFKTIERMAVTNQDQASAETISKSIAHADWLNDHQSAEEEYEYVKQQNFKDSQDPELLWRFGRACHCVYTYSNTAKAVKAAAIRDGLSAVEKAVHIDSQNANSFVVSVLNYIACYLSMSMQVSLAVFKQASALIFS